MSTIKLNINHLNTPIKRQRLSDSIEKQDPSICYLEDTDFKQRHKQSKSMKKNTMLILIKRKIDSHFQSQNLLESYSNQDSMILAQDEHLEQQNRIKNSEINLGQLISDKGAKKFNG